MPTVVDSNLCDGALLNQVPGPHPLIDESAAGQPLYFNTYSGPDSNGQIWVCASVEDVAETVVLPIGVGPQPLVTFVPDPDTPVVG